jgi:hypothetical protein
MKRVRFYALTRNAQDRFIAATRGAVPRPLLVRLVGAPFPWVWAFCSVLSLTTFVVLVRWGYGDLYNDVALAPKSWIVAFGLTLVAAIFCGLQAVARFMEARKLPFARGHYLFPSAWFDATSVDFKVRSLLEVRAVEVSGSTVTVRFADGVGSFPLPKGTEAGAIEEAIQTAKNELQAARVNGDLQHESSLDPAAEPRYSNPLAPRAAHRPQTPGFRKLALPIALVLGGLLGTLSGLYRNRSSERLLYVTARTLDTPEAYRAYLARGGARPDVGQLLLPNAELRRVVELRSLAALESYAMGQQNSVIKPAVDLALRSALLDALEKAKEPKSMTALAEFSRSHPQFGGLVANEVRAARRELMRALGERFVRDFASKTDGLEPLVMALMQRLADKGPRLAVRFQRVVPESVERADKIVQRDKFFAKVMLPSQYFDAEHSTERERVLFEHLHARFSEAFPKDALELVLGEPLDGTGPLPTSVDEPTLALSHSTNMGSGIPNQKPNGTFVGIGFLFRAKFFVPGGPSPLETKHSIWRLPDLLRLRKGTVTIPQVYLNMADDAFSSFDAKVLGWLFKSSNN